jgi:dTDP-4-dehydrorhamnose 3,5-epimerase
VESFHQKHYEEALKEKGVDIHFVQDDFSFSFKDVLRGIHGDDKTWKLVSCPQGRIYYVVTCCDKESPQFGQWQGFTISEENYQQVLVPPKHGASFLALSNCTFHYKQTSYYEDCQQFTYNALDQYFNINWASMCKDPIMSERDKNAEFFNKANIGFNSNTQNHT